MSSKTKNKKHNMSHKFVEAGRIAGLQQKLTKLLSRKLSLEHSMTRIEKGCSVYVNYCEKLKQAISNVKDPESIESMKLSVELEENTWKANGLVTTFKNSKREYEHHILPQVEEVLKALKITRKDIEFQNIDKQAEKLINSDIYGSTEKLPANIEHTEIMLSYKKNISLLRNLSNATFKKWEGNKNDSLTTAVLEKNMYDYNLQIENLEKRLLKRKDYYNNVFMPEYDRDMKDCEQNLDKYLQRAKALCVLQIDPKLPFVLSEYSKNKDDDEKLWLFWTALRVRVDDIVEEIKKDEVKYKAHLHLMTPIRE